MKTKKITWRVLLAASACAALAAVTGLPPAGAQSQQREEVREEFHQTYQIASGGRVSLENINGAVRVTSWDRNEVKVDAVKRAQIVERLAEAEIRIDATGDAVRIKTKYPEYKYGSKGEPGPAVVDYTLTVPRGARLDAITLINGALDIEGVAGDINASSINGSVMARGLAGRARLSTINGTLKADFSRLGDDANVELTSVNGLVGVIIPSDANAEVRANTVHGSITNDFGLPVRRGRFIGQDLAGMLGRGGPMIKLSNVNGPVQVNRASDGRALSPATNLLSEARRDDEEGDDELEDERREMEDSAREAAEEAAKDAARAVEEAQKVTREIEREQRGEARRAERDVEREVQREAIEAAKEATRHAAEVAREVSREVSREVRAGGGPHDDARVFDRQTNTFKTSASPRVRVETFDGNVTVRAWDKPEVMYTAFKRAHDEKEMRGISTRAHQVGEEVALAAEFDKNFASQVDSQGSRIVSFSSAASVSYEIYVPRGATLRVTSGDGRLDVQGVNGEMELRTGDGAVGVVGGRGRLKVETGDGRIEVNDYDGEVDARTGDGRISLDGRFTRLAARTGDGSISLSVPADLNAVIETDATSVINDGLAAEEGGEGSPEGRRVRRWRVGQGGGRTFTLHTGDGRIVLRRR